MCGVLDFLWPQTLFLLADMSSCQPMVNGGWVGGSRVPALIITSAPITWSITPTKDVHCRGNTVEYVLYAHDVISFFVGAILQVMAADIDSGR